MATPQTLAEPTVLTFKSGQAGVLRRSPETEVINFSGDSVLNRGDANIIFASGASVLHRGALTSGVSSQQERRVNSAGVAARTGIRYVLEVYRDDKLEAAMPLPRQPAYKRVRKKPLKSIRYTLGVEPIRELTEDRVWSIELGGFTGLNTRAYQKAFGAGMSASGLEALIQFDQFLATYQQLAMTDGTLYMRSPDNFGQLYNRTYMVFRDFDEGYAYKVEVDSFDWDRNGNTSVGNAAWRIALHGYLFMARRETGGLHANTAKRRFVKPDIPDELKDKNAIALYSQVRSRDQNRADRLRNSLVDAEQSKVFSVVNAPAGVSTSSILAAVQKCRQPFLQYQKTLRTYQEAVHTLYDEATAPLKLIGDVIQSAEATLAALYDVRNLGYEFHTMVDSYSVRLTGMMFGIEHLADTLRTNYIKRGGNPRSLKVNAQGLSDGQMQAGPVDNSIIQPDSQPVPVISHSVQLGETWQSIATHYYGSPDAWLFLAKYNGSPDAYSVGSSDPLTSGVTVLIPGVAVSPNVLPSAFGPGDLYGTDFQFDFSTGDFVLGSQPWTAWDGAQFNTTEPALVDISTVSGPANFKQALIHRILTVRGEVPGLPNYGIFPVAPGDSITPSMLSMLLSTLASQLMQDPRVVSVTEATMSVQGDQIDLEVEVQSLARAQVSLATPLQ